MARPSTQRIVTEDAEVGDRVRIVVTGRSCSISQEGVMLEATAADCLTIKLDNGYNVTHPVSDIDSIAKVASSSSPSNVRSISDSASEEADASEDDELPLVVLLHTGGTIASKVDYATGAVTARFEPEEIIDAVPELSSIARIRAVKLGNMWSDDMRPRHWNRILEGTAKAFDSDAAGVVVTHGTDTMHLTAAALAFAWAGEGGRPPGRIVLTGAQRSADRGSSDAAENLIAAVHWAANGPPASGERDASVIVMHDSGSDGVCAVLPGCAARKSHSSRRDAFRAVNQPPLAKISIRGGRPTIEGNLTTAPTREVSDKPHLFDEETTIAEFLANGHMRAKFLTAAIDAGAAALLVHGTGLGHLPLDDPAGDSPENRELARVLSEHCAAGGIVVVTTQCIDGPVNMDVYAKGREQQEMGLIGHGASSPPGIALVKLHHLLSRGLDVQAIRRIWSEDLVGENPHSILE